MPGSNIGRKQEVERALSASKDTYVQSYSHLKGRPHEEKAIPMLRKVASLVKPIMREHGWTLPLLSGLEDQVASFLTLKYLCRVLPR